MERAPSWRASLEALDEEKAALKDSNFASLVRSREVRCTKEEEVVEWSERDEESRKDIGENRERRAAFSGNVKEGSGGFRRRRLQQFEKRGGEGACGQLFQPQGGNGAFERGRSGRREGRGGGKSWRRRKKRLEEAERTFSIRC